MKWISGAIVAAALLASAAFYSRLPQRMAIHWNASGTADGFADKAVGAFLMPIVILLVALMFAVLPKISPDGFGIEAAARGYRAIWLVSLVGLGAMHVVALLAASGARVDMAMVIPIFVGAILAVTGNYLTTMPRNFFVGIRTPWTLASEDVWFRTHRLGGRLFMAGGVAVMLLPLFGKGVLLPGLLVIVTATAVATIAYSYVIYRKTAG